MVVFEALSHFRSSYFGIFKRNSYWLFACSANYLILYVLSNITLLYFLHAISILIIQKVAFQLCIYKSSCQKCMCLKTAGWPPACQILSSSKCAQRSCLFPIPKYPHYLFPLFLSFCLAFPYPNNTMTSTSINTPLFVSLVFSLLTFMPIFIFCQYFLKEMCKMCNKCSKDGNNSNDTLIVFALRLCVVLCSQPLSPQVSGSLKTKYPFPSSSFI